MGWNPEEHYIWIEPNVKYLLSTPYAARYAPVPWYNRPPPRPINPGPPPDKLRYVSTRRIHHAFEHGTLFKQTVADDLDSLMQTFLNALLKCTGYMPCLLKHYGQQDLWQLGKSRDEAYEHFWLVADRQKREKEARERRERKAIEGASSSTEDDTGVAVESVAARDTEAGAAEVEPGPEGVDAMVEPLYKMMKLSGSLLYAEKRAGRETKEQRDQRAAEHYEKFTDAMQKVLEAAEVGDKRRAMRKAAQKAEKERGKVDKEEARMLDDDEASTEEDLMDVDQEVSEDASIAGEGENIGTDAAVTETSDDPDDVASSSSTELDDISSPPKKRVRIE